MERIFCDDGWPVIRFFQLSVVVSWAGITATYSDPLQIPLKMDVNIMKDTHNLI